MNVFMQAPTVPMAQFPSMAQPNVDAPACDPYHGQSYLMQHYEQQHPDFARTSNLGASDGYFSGNEHAGCPITAPSANAPASMNYPLNMHFGQLGQQPMGFSTTGTFNTYLQRNIVPPFFEEGYGSACPSRSATESPSINQRHNMFCLCGQANCPTLMSSLAFTIDMEGLAAYGFPQFTSDVAWYSPMQ